MFLWWCLWELIIRTRSVNMRLYLSTLRSLPRYRWVGNQWFHQNKYRDTEIGMLSSRPFIFNISNLLYFSLYVCFQNSKCFSNILEWIQEFDSIWKRYNTPPRLFVRFHTRWAGRWDSPPGHCCRLPTGVPHKARKGLSALDPQTYLRKWRTPALLRTVQ